MSSLRAEKPRLARSGSWRRPLFWFWLALCVLLPLQWLSVYQSEFFWSPPKAIGDGPDYENIAFHLWQGEGFMLDNTDREWRRIYIQRGSEYDAQLNATAQNLIATGRPPLLPLVISGVYRVVGRNDFGFAGVRILLASCLAIGGALAVWNTGRLLGGSARSWTLPVGCMATLLFASTSRTLRDYATDFLTEPLALLLMQIFVSLVIALSAPAPTRPWPTSAWASAWAGAAFGGLILTRSMFVVWLPAVGLLTILATPFRYKERLQAGFLVVGVACIVCLPWWVRNSLVLGRWMPLGTQGPITLLGGYSDIALESNGDWQFEPERRLREELGASKDFQLLASDTEREVAVAEVAKRRVGAWIWQHLGELPLLAAKRIYVHWNPYTGRSLIWKVAMIMGAIGLLVRRERRASWLLGLPLTSTIVVAAFYSTGGRFLVPLYGILFSLAGLGMAALSQLLDRLLQPPSARRG